MTNQSHTIMEPAPTKKRTNWHHIAKLAVLASMAGILFFLFLICAVYVYSHTRWPYNFLFTGIGFCTFLLVLFTLIRSKTYRSNFSAYNFSGLSAQDALLIKLMENLNFEINKFETAASYYFHAVKSYKYYTVVLAGLSTVILGLDLTGVQLPFTGNYTLLAKNIALVIGAIITIISTMAIYWNLEKYWLQNKIILQKFRQLREDIELADKKAALSHEEINDYCEQFREIKSNFYKYWEGVQAERNKQ